MINILQNHQNMDSHFHKDFNTTNYFSISVYLK